MNNNFVIIRFSSYLMMEATLPEPTVRPPSRLFEAVFQVFSVAYCYGICILSHVISLLFLFFRIHGTVLAPVFILVTILRS